MCVGRARCVWDGLAVYVMGYVCWDGLGLCGMDVCGMGKVLWDGIGVCGVG